MKITRIADQVRNIPLREVLERYGFEVKAEGTTLRAKGDHHNIVVTGSKWFDNKAGVGGARRNRLGDPPRQGGFFRSLPVSGQRVLAKRSRGSVGASLS